MNFSTTTTSTHITFKATYGETACNFPTRNPRRYRLPKILFELIALLTIPRPRPLRDSTPPDRRQPRCTTNHSTGFG